MDEKMVRAKVQSIFHKTSFLEDPEIVSVTLNEEGNYEVLVDDPSNQYGYRQLNLDGHGLGYKWEENEINPSFTERYIL